MLLLLLIIINIIIIIIIINIKFIIIKIIIIIIIILIIIIIINIALTYVSSTLVSFALVSLTLNKDEEILLTVDMRLEILQTDVAFHHSYILRAISGNLIQFNNTKKGDMGNSMGKRTEGQN